MSDSLEKQNNVQCQKYSKKKAAKRKIGHSNTKQNWLEILLKMFDAVNLKISSMKLEIRSKHAYILV